MSNPITPSRPVRGAIAADSSPAPRLRTLSNDDVLAGYDRVRALYPFVPSLSLWRSWECAAYAACSLTEPVLDVGCGDGAFFRLLWPGLRRVVGVEADPAVAERAEASGVYERVLRVSADAIPAGETGYGSAFANCSLEHMSDLDAVLAAIHRALAPGGRLVASVVTDRFVSWQTLGPLVGRSAGPASGDAARQAFMRHHHLENPLTVGDWVGRLGAAGFVVKEHVPLLGQVTARAFLAFDEIWHLPGGRGGHHEVGEDVQAFLAARPAFPAAFRHVLRGLLEMDEGDREACGAVFVAEKPSPR